MRELPPAGRCRKDEPMATYDTEIHTGGGGWQQDRPLSASVGV
ncbi:hypothetical protein ACHZ98_24000 [Streptomyces sp. MAR4 CNY-716]